MVHQAIKVSDTLDELGMAVGVIDLHRLKPVNTELLFTYLRGVRRVVTLEEHLLAGGMGSAIAEIFVDEGVTTPMLRIGQDDRFVFDYGGREVIWEKYGLDVQGITGRILNWLNRVK
jgi:transketolase